MNRPLARATARELIATWVLEGRFVAGEQLKVAHLASATGLGLTPLREAMIEAAGMGLVENRPGCGFFVPPLTLREIMELYPMIWGLEGLALRVTPEFTPAHLDRLRAINARFASDVRDREAFDLDIEWHRVLVAECGNRLILETLAEVKTRSRRYELAFQRAAGHRPISVVHHDRIVEALERDDRAEAARVLELNWAAGPVFMRQWLAAGHREDQGSPRAGSR